MVKHLRSNCSAPSQKDIVRLFGSTTVRHSLGSGRMRSGVVQLNPFSSKTLGASDRERLFLCGVEQGGLALQNAFSALETMARPKRFELLTPRFVVWCSIQLSYGRVFRWASWAFNARMHPITVRKVAKERFSYPLRPRLARSASCDLPAELEAGSLTASSGRPFGHTRNLYAITGN